MRPSEKPRFVTALQALFAMWQQELTDALSLGYWMGLKDLELSEVEAAIWRAVKECGFLPKVKDIREKAGRGPGTPPYYKRWEDPVRRLSPGPKTVGELLPEAMKWPGKGE